MLKFYVKSAYETLFGNFPFEIDDEEDVVNIGNATDKEFNALKNIYEHTKLSLVYLTKEDLEKTNCPISVSRMIH